MSTYRVAGMCKPYLNDSLRRFTSVAIRCDTSEETRMQHESALPINQLWKTGEHFQRSALPVVAVPVTIAVCSLGGGSDLIIFLARHRTFFHN